MVLYHWDTKIREVEQVSLTKKSQVYTLGFFSYLLQSYSIPKSSTIKVKVAFGPIPA